MSVGNDMHKLARKLWPIHRSITGEGVRETLGILTEIIDDLNVTEVDSGSDVFDWQVPKEWRVREAYIISPSGEKIIDISNNNLHLVSYSTPVDIDISLKDLQAHLYSLEEQPDAIPYITSYYTERWGFCLSYNQRKKLEQGIYHVCIDTELFDGSLTYGEVIIPGKTDKEIFVSTYVCHPSMANNELSGPVVTTYLCKWLQSLDGNHKYTYRVVFIPETIGSITYLSKNLDVLKEKVIAGFNVTCIGDDRSYSYLPSRNGNTLADKVSKHVLRWTDSDFTSYSWSERGSDERQYCSPGVDLPMVSVMRTKYGEYPEYHTSLDDLENVVTPNGLDGGLNILKRAITALEKNCYPKVTVFCEPQLGKRGLYPTLGTKDNNKKVRELMDLLSYSDGTYSLLDIADFSNVPIWNLYDHVDTLVENNLIKLSYISENG